MRAAILILFAFATPLCHADNKGDKLSTSIFVASDRHGQGNTLTSLLTSVMSDPDVVKPSVVLLGGDYVGEDDRLDSNPHSSSSDSIRRPPMSEHHSSPSEHGHRPSGHSHHSSSTPFSITTLQHDVDSAMTGNSYVSLFTYGSHDKGAKEGYGAFFSGPYTADGYYLYGISYAQMIYDTADSTYNGIDKSDASGYCAQTATACFDKWVSTLSDSKPIIIMSHVPIHALRNDNQGGERWYQSITKAAGKHDILLLYCHNHTVEESGRVSDKQNYLLVPGDSIVTQGVVVRGEGHNIASSATYNHKLNFYYANAGYIKNGYATLITLRRDNPSADYNTMNLKRYSVKDPMPATIGDTGKANPYVISFGSKK